MERRFSLLLGCFFLSGAAGLIDQTAWAQQFALVFGASELALATVLAAFMAGLALGAAAAGRLAARSGRPLRLYALLEVGAGLAALAVPAGLRLAETAQSALFAGGPLRDVPATAAGFAFAASFAILVVPTALMGASLPLLAAHAVRRDEEVASRVAVLYTANTLGAAAGALAGAFVLLPALGLGRTVAAAASLNALAALGALALDRGAPRPPPLPLPAAGGRSWVLPLSLLSGGVAFVHEVVWTRLLGPLLGGSVYAFGTLLATVLFGLALGGALAARLGATRERARRALAVAELAAAALTLGAFVVAERLPALVGPAGAGVATNGVATKAALAAALLLPGVAALGAAFPLAVRVLAAGAADAPAAAGRVFAWNTAGAIAGALAAGHWILPALGYADTAAALAAVGLALGAWAAVAERPRLWVVVAAAAAGLGLLAVVRPARPWRLLLGPAHAQTTPEVVFEAVGRSANVLVLDAGSGLRLTTNGLPESLIERPGALPANLAVARWLTLLPLAARPDARSLLVVGLGGGVSLEEVPAGIAALHVVELEPEVIRANRAVAAERRRDPLADPRLVVHVGDARTALRLTDQRFDAIVSQPSHPWTTGSAHLYTRELFAAVAARLADGGVFVQWIGLHFIDGELLRSLVATLADVFPEVEVYAPQGEALLFLASARPLDLARTAPLAVAAAPEAWRRADVKTAEDVVLRRLLDAPAARRFAAGAPLVRDLANRLQTRSPRLLDSPPELLQPGALDALLAPFDPPAPELPADLYPIRRWLLDGNEARAARWAAAQADPAARWTALGLVELEAGRRRRAEGLLRDARDADPGAAAPRHALLRLYQDEVRAGRPLALLADLPDEPAAVVVEGWRRSSRDDWPGVAALEAALAAVGSRHPLALEALRLRVERRLAGGDPALAREALLLLDEGLGGHPPPADLLLRARAARAAGDVPAAAASLEALSRRMTRRAAR